MREEGNICRRNPEVEAEGEKSLFWKKKSGEKGGSCAKTQGGVTYKSKAVNYN